MVPQVVPVVQPPRPSSSATNHCRVCNRLYTSTSALDQHYRDTPVHPKCTRCNVGFMDNAAILAVSFLTVFPIWVVSHKCRHLPKHNASAPAVFVIGDSLTQLRSSSTIVTLPCIQTAQAAILGSWIMPLCRPCVPFICFLSCSYTLTKIDQSTWIASIARLSAGSVTA